MYKCLTVFVLVLICSVMGYPETATSSESMEDFIKLAENCVAQEGAEEEDLEILLTRKIPNSKAGACIPACLFETFGIMRNNRLDVQNLIALAEEEFESDEKSIQIVRDLANDCADVTDDDRCEAAIKIYECGHISAKVRGVNFDDF